MTWWGIYQLGQWLIRLVMVPLILHRRLNPAASLSWLTLIFFIPEVGLLFYLLFGDRRLGRKRVRMHRQVIRMMRSELRMARQQAHQTRPQIEPEQMPLIRQVESIGGMPIVRSNAVELLTDAGTTIDRLIADIEAAQHHVHLLFYIFKPDETGNRVSQALARAVERGVTVRVLADAVGSRALFAYGGLASWLSERKVQIFPALPVDPLRLKLARLDLRNHRKIAVIDGRIAYTGSQNIVNADFGSRAGAWIDIMGRFAGPVVSQIQIVFLEDWAFETGEELDGDELLSLGGPAGDMPAQAVATGPSTDESQNFRRVLLAAINVALRKVIITTPYIVLDEPTMVALTMAADRGAEVHLVVPKRSDHRLVAAAGRAGYAPLLEAGVNIHLYKPAMLHAKTLTVDDSFALLGSANLDTRSFYLNFEINVLMYGQQITREMRFAQMRYMSDSEPIDLAQWAKRPKLRQYSEMAAALFSPLI